MVRLRRGYFGGGNSWRQRRTKQTHAARKRPAAWLTVECLEERQLLAAAALAFLAQPADIAAGKTMTAVKVQLLNPDNSVDTTSSAPVTLALKDSIGGAILHGTLTQNAVQGVATFNDMYLTTDLIGTGAFTLYASAVTPTAVLTSPLSQPFKLQAGAYAFNFTAQPKNVAAGSTVGPVTVQLVDQNGKPFTGASDVTTVALYLDNNSGGAAFVDVNGNVKASPPTATLTNGIATFPSVFLNKVGVGYTLGVVPATPSRSVGRGRSAPFNVLPGAAASLAFSVPPTPTAAGKPVNGDLVPAGVVVQVRDKFNNLVTGSSATVQMTATGPGSLTGTTSVQAVNGVAAFSNLVLSTTGSYTLKATSGAMSATSGSFTVAAASAVPAELAVVSAPTDPVPNGGPVGTIQVAVRDANHNVLTSDNTTQIRITLDPPNSGEPGGNLFGAVSAPVVKGVATFDKLVISGVALKTGTAFASFNLTAQAFNRPALPTVKAPVKVAHGQAADFRILSGGNQPTAPSGTPLQPITVALTDVNGNVIVDNPAETVSLGIKPNGSPPRTPISEIHFTLKDNSDVLYATQPLVNGLATFSTADNPLVILPVNNNYVLSAGSADKVYNTTQTAPFNIIPAKPDHVSFDGQPLTSNLNTVLNGGGAGGSITLKVFDKQSSLLENDNTTQVKVTLDATDAKPAIDGQTLPDVELLGDTTATAARGIITFNRLWIRVKSGNANPVKGYKLVVTPVSTDIKAATSNLFDANPPASGPFAVNVTFTVQPQGGLVASNLPSFKVKLTDGSGNGAPFKDEQIKTYITRNENGAVLAGPNVQTVDANGEATFSNMQITQAGTYTIQAVATLGGVFNTSNPVVIKVPSASSRTVGPQLSPKASLQVTTDVTGDIVKVGLGSFTTNFDTIRNMPLYTQTAEGTPKIPSFFPPSYTFGDGEVAKLAHPTVAAGFTQVPQTSDWWSSLIFRRQPAANFEGISKDSQGNQLFPVHPNPFSAMSASGGLGLSFLGEPEVGLVNLPTSTFPSTTDPRFPSASDFDVHYGGSAMDATNISHADDRLFQDLQVGLQGLNADAKPLSYSDWTFTLDWNGQLRATLGEGLPYTYFTAPAGGVFQISATTSSIKKPKFTAIAFDANGQNPQAGATSGSGPLILTVEYSVRAFQELLDHFGTFPTVTVKRSYGIFLPKGVSWTLTTGDNPSLKTGTVTAAQGFLSVAPLPDTTTPTFTFFRQHAYSFVTDATAGFNYDDKTGDLTNTFLLTTTLKASGFTDAVDVPLQALYPQQWTELPPGVKLSSFTFDSPRGTLKVLEGKSFITETQHLGGTLPFLPDFKDQAGGYHADLWRSYLYPLLIKASTQPTRDGGNSLSLDLLMPGGNTYGNGQSLLGAAQLVPMLLQVSQSSDLRPDEQALAKQYAQQVLDAVKNQLGAWLSATDDQSILLYYFEGDKVKGSVDAGALGWNTMLGEEGGFGSTESINDQHLGLGYHLKTAAIVSLYDPTWSGLDRMGGIVNLIAAQVANDDRANLIHAQNPLIPALPFLRNFDPYAGHSWADGAGNSKDGNNQESFSEALNFYTGLIQWGESTGDKNLRDLGIYLYNNEVNSFFLNIFNQNPALGTYPQGYTYGLQSTTDAGTSATASYNFGQPVPKPSDSTDPVATGFVVSKGAVIQSFTVAANGTATFAFTYTPPTPTPATFVTAGTVNFTAGTASFTWNNATPGASYVVVYPFAMPKTNVVGIQSAGATGQTFFGVETTKLAGIQILPVNGSSYWLAGRLPTLAANQAFIKADVANMLKEPRQEGTVPIQHDVYLTTTYAYEALQDPATALTDFKKALGDDNLDPFNNNGSDRNAINLHWISGLKELGAVDTTVTADTTSYVVFNKNGTRTYVAYNPDPLPRKVTFKLPEGGTFVLTVPARSQASSQGVTTGPADLSVKTPLGRFFLNNQKGAFVGKAGPGESRQRIPGGTGTQQNPVINPPTDLSKLLTFTIKGVSGVFDPTQQTQFSLWLDPGFLPANGGVVPNVRVAVAYDPDGKGTNVVQQQYGDFGVPRGRPGWVEYSSTRAILQTLTPPPAVMKNGTVTIKVWVSIGSTPIDLRTEAAEEQGRVSSVTIPYTISNIAPLLTSALADQTTQELAPLTLQDNVTDPDQVGNTTDTWQVRFQSTGALVAQGTGPSLTFVPTAPGTYLADFTATDSAGATTTDETVITVTPVPEAEYVRGLYQTVLHRAPDIAGLEQLTGLLQSGTPRATVAAAFWESPEHRALEVNALYVHYLHRAADPLGLAGWVSALEQGRGENTVALALVTSPEYQAFHPGDPAFILALYTDVLGRPADAAGLNAWLMARQFGASLSAVAAAFLTSDESTTRQIEGAYQALLGRPADAAGLNFWLPAIRAHQQSVDTLAEALLASNEFFQTAQP